MGTATDDFNRADGAPGAGWSTNTSVYALPAIASNKLVGVGALSGASRVAETFAADHSSSLELPGSLGSGHWVGVATRWTSNGDNLYVGIYFFSDPSYVVQLYKHASGSFTQLGSTVGLGTSPQAAGTPLKLAVAGTTLDLSLGGVSQINLTDATHSAGVPGVLFAGGGDPADNWRGEGALVAARFQAVVLA